MMNAPSLRAGYGGTIKRGRDLAPSFSRRAALRWQVGSTNAYSGERVGIFIRCYEAAILPIAVSRLRCGFLAKSHH